MKGLIKYTPKTQTKVEGQMSEYGADRAGNKLANAAVIAAWLFGLSALIIAIGMAYKNFIG
ncbi:hypothetical protein [Acinetobacter sp. yr461]|uniref:hypothetical protein n=1 Tax=Acinetobacter sp. yr461 TaxID=1761742 RepID=UPI0008AF841B|nr:hypothetical protein [Acinetobacter sp. yr461]SEO62263.1 hypothetical protein SAMN04487817_10831 [Acinetobacter sp. yr461]